MAGGFLTALLPEGIRWERNEMLWYRLAMGRGQGACEAGVERRDRAFELPGQCFEHCRSNDLMDIYRRRKGNH
jgi:hypothetical protein